MSIFGVILAGGEGTRFGCIDKAALRLKNRSFVQHLFKRIESQTMQIALVGHTNAPVPDKVTRLPDGFDPPIGPLGGIYAGAKWVNELAVPAPTSWLLTAPVDGPLFPADFVHHVRPLMEIRSPIIGRYGDDLYPVCGMWPVEMALRIPDLLAQQAGYALRPMLRALTAQEFDFLPYYPQNPFANANNVSDLLALSRQMQP